MTPLPSQVGGEPRELRLRQRQRGGLRAVGPGGGATSGGVTGGGATSGDEPQSDKM